VAVGAAFAVNCTSSLEQHLADAEAAGSTQEEITQIVKLAAFIKERAASHVERLVSLSEEHAA
jgi:alkylhydroperoxidase/carboxymuconolactone decarboxylase family protein YurZ